MFGGHSRVIIFLLVHRITQGYYIFIHETEWFTLTFVACDAHVHEFRKIKFLPASVSNEVSFDCWKTVCQRCTKKYVTYLNILATCVTSFDQIALSMRKTTFDCTKVPIQFFFGRKLCSRHGLKEDHRWACKKWIKLTVRHKNVVSVLRMPYSTEFYDNLFKGGLTYMSLLKATMVYVLDTFVTLYS